MGSFFSASTIFQPRYGRNQQPRNHEPTILRVESKNDTISTKPSYISHSPNQTAIQPQPKNWRKIVRSESFAGEVPRIVHAKITQPRHVRYLARNALTHTLKEKTDIHPYPCQAQLICRDVNVILLSELSLNFTKLLCCYEFPHVLPPYAT